MLNKASWNLKAWLLWRRLLFNYMLSLCDTSLLSPVYFLILSYTQRFWNPGGRPNEASAFVVVKRCFIAQGYHFHFLLIDVYKRKHLSTHYLSSTSSYIILPLKYYGIDCVLLDGFVRENLWVFQWCSIWKAISELPSRVSACGLLGCDGRYSEQKTVQTNVPHCFESEWTGSLWKIRFIVIATSRTVRSETKRQPSRNNPSHTRLHECRKNRTECRKKLQNTWTVQ